MMDIIFAQGQWEDVNQVSGLYDDICKYLSENINYPGWKKDVYPDRQTAMDGISGGSLYTVKYGDSLIGSFIIRHKPKTAYHSAKWLTDSDYRYIYVIYTLAVHPDYLNQGSGEKILSFVSNLGVKMGMKSIRLDVYAGNYPAARLYEKSGFQYIDTVDLGLAEYGLKNFRLYEKIL